MSFDPSRLHRLSGCGPLVMVVAVACDLSGQVPTPSNPHVPTDDSYSTRFVAFSPRSGPPGTEVTVSGEGPAGGHSRLSWDGRSPLGL